eukprot:EG_transcript_28795
MLRRAALTASLAAGLGGPGRGMARLGTLFAPTARLAMAPTALTLLRATPILLKDKRKKKVRIMYQFRSGAGTGQFFATMKSRKSRDLGKRYCIRMDYVVNRPVVWREAKLKSGKAPQFKGYRARERKERQDALEERRRLARERAKAAAGTTDKGKEKGKEKGKAKDKAKEREAGPPREAKGPAAEQAAAAAE